MRINEMFNVTDYILCGLLITLFLFISKQHDIVQFFYLQVLDRWIGFLHRQVEFHSKLRPEIVRSEHFCIIFWILCKKQDFNINWLYNKLFSVPRMDKMLTLNWSHSYINKLLVTYAIFNLYSKFSNSLLQYMFVMAWKIIYKFLKKVLVPPVHKQ